MQLEQVIQQLELLAPPSFAESWDNSGLMCGRKKKEIEKILISVDATDEVIQEAVLSDTDLLLTHHPLIFPTISGLTEDNIAGRRLLKLVQADICCYAMHTNFDVIGMADEAADRLQLLNRDVLYVTFEDALSKEGIGRIGALLQEMSLRECAELVKEVFLVETVRVYGDPDMRVRMAAVLPGSGKKMSGYAIRAGADVLITGDIDHHEGIDAAAAGMGIIDAGHYGIEKIFLPYMKQFFLKKMPDMTVVCASQKEPFIVI